MSLQRGSQGLTQAPAASGYAGPQSERDALGRFGRGNTAAVTHGARSAQFWAAAQAEVERLAGAIVADAGATLDDAPALLRRGAYAAARAALVEEGCFIRLAETGGPATSHDRTRAAFTRWTSAQGVLRDWCRLLGVRRVPKPAPSLAEYLERRSAELEAQRASEPEPPAGEAGADEDVNREDGHHE